MEETPMLFPIAPAEFWKQIKIIIEDVIAEKLTQQKISPPNNHLPDDTRETAIRIIAAKQPIQNPLLCRYLKQRKIEKNIADEYCYEVEFSNGSNDKTYIAIGFKNNAGGYELRNEYFKGSSSPKYITYVDNSADKITVFEGFFDFLSYQTIHQTQQQEMIDLPVRQANFLVLNSLSFF